MADEDIKMLFEGDDRGLLRSFLAINGAVKQVDQNLSEVGKKTKIINEESTQTKGLFDKIAPQVTSIVAGIGLWSLGTKAASEATKALVRDYEELIKRQDIAGKAALNLSKLTLRSMGLNTIAASDEMKKEFTSAAARLGDSPEALIQAYATQMPSGASHADKMQAAKALTAMNDLINVDKIGGVAAELKAAIPGVSGRDAVDLALVMNKASREKSDVLESAMLGFRQMTEAGAKPDTALAIMTSLADQGYNARQMQTFSSMLGSDISPVEAQYGKRLSDKDRIQNKIAGMDINQRIDWAYQNRAEFETYFGKEAYRFLPALDAGKLGRAQGLISSAYSDDIVGQYLRDAGQTQTFKMLSAEDAGRAAVDAARLGTPEDQLTGQMRGSYREFIDAQPFTNLPFGTRWIGRAYYKYQPEFGSDEQARRQMIENVGDFYRGGPDDPQQQSTRQLIDALDVLNKTLQENNRRTEANTRATGGGVVVME